MNPLSALAKFLISELFRKREEEEDGFHNGVRRKSDTEIDGRPEGKGQKI